MLMRRSCGTTAGKRRRPWLATMAYAASALLAGCSGALDDSVSRPAAAPAQAVAPGATRSGSAAAPVAWSPQAQSSRAEHAVDPYDGALVNPRTQRQGASEYLNGVNLFFETKEEMLEAVAAYAAANPRLEVIRGYGWTPDAFGGAMPSALELDGAVRDRPVILLSADLRSAWRNSRAAGLPIAPVPDR